jgi:hypothetical protein
VHALKTNTKMERRPGKKIFTIRINGATVGRNEKQIDRSTGGQPLRCRVRGAALLS